MNDTLPQMTHYAAAGDFWTARIPNVYVNGKHFFFIHERANMSLSCVVASFEQVKVWYCARLRVVIRDIE